ncbi:hypothetical protein EDC01DRAFT_177785 [Geopyxis carbonaria]|nr:hypothetical protein EDC01DRAFT_177785 [Geopyxis carbonaria]
MKKHPRRPAHTALTLLLNAYLPRSSVSTYFFSEFKLMVKNQTTTKKLFIIFLQSRSRVNEIQSTYYREYYNVISIRRLKIYKTLNCCRKELPSSPQQHPSRSS